MKVNLHLKYFSEHLCHKMVPSGAHFTANVTQVLSCLQSFLLVRIHSVLFLEHDLYLPITEMGIDYEDYKIPVKVLLHRLWQ